MLRSICFVCNEYPPSPHGGIGTFTQIIGRELVKLGYKVRCVGVYSESSASPAYEVDEGVEVFRLEHEHKDVLSLRTRYKLFRQIAEWSRARAIDVVEIPDFQGWAAGWPSLPIPVVVRTHGSGSYFRRELGKPHTMRSRLAFATERASLRRADSWCSVSRYTAVKTQALFGSKPADTVTYNPVSLPEQANPYERSRNRIIFTGTLTLKKGIASLMRAWPHVVADCPEAELHIFGKDPSNLLPSLMAGYGETARSSVHFHGHTLRNLVLEELNTARAAVFPSYAEAFAFAPLEAMAAACPTIYSTRTSGPEAIEHGHDGLLIDPYDPSQIAGAIKSLLGDDELAARLGAAGREKVRAQFAMEAVLPKIAKFYEDSIDAFERSAGQRVAA
ncbi:MAG TPA: glycosyltransferase family 4 protein [Bryobacteraceae bacterium]|nr:glycosyltransferase family 4 protein [Bryobacteraceae bacterium]